jgi:LCP family protein required for cell wall assembly
LTILLAFFIGVLIYLLIPIRTNILLLGTDSRVEGDALGRTDTIILTTIVPLRPDIGMLSVPRDLWVSIPDNGENRVNAAFFFAEGTEPGTGATATSETIKVNFGVEMDYYLLIQFEGVREVVEALGGVEITLPEPMSGYGAGTHILDGEQALAFVRDRSGSDDFFRMQRGQIFIKSFWNQILNPSSWGKIPNIILVMSNFIETDIPFWIWPRLGIALLRVGPEGTDNRVISRDFVFPFTTSGGAQVLGPNWQAIDPMVSEIFAVEPKERQ